MGFTFLELHMLNAKGACTCAWYSNTRKASPAEKARRRAQGIPVNTCKNPGKHPVSSGSKAVMTDIDAIEAHLDKGGSVGMVLRLEALPEAPMRLVILDCDRPGSKEWLESRGITSPLMVKGKRGWHFYALLPGDCPDLKSDTMTLNPGKNQSVTDERPGIDIKVSGHIVIPFSPNKTLIYQGRDISEDPTAVRSIFKDLASLEAVLPVIDPRVLVPTMKAFVPDQAGTPRVGSKKTGKTKRIVLSKAKVHKGKITGPLKGLPYNLRKRMAVWHVRRAKPGTGEWRGRAMLRILYGLSKHYWLTEEDRFQVVLKHFNGRLQDESGVRHPFGEGELRRMVRHSSHDSVVSPFGLDGEESPYPFDVESAIEKARKKKNPRANQRRERQRQQDASFVHAEVSRFIYEECVTTNDPTLKIRQADLHHAYGEWTVDQPVPAPASPKRFGQILTRLGFEKGRFGHDGDLHRLGITRAKLSAGIDLAPELQAHSRHWAAPARGSRIPAPFPLMRMSSSHLLLGGYRSFSTPGESFLTRIAPTEIWASNIYAGIFSNSIWRVPSGRFELLRSTLRAGYPYQI